MAVWHEIYWDHQQGSQPAVGSKAGKTHESKWSVPRPVYDRGRPAEGQPVLSLIGRHRDALLRESEWW